jgi:hypothetical protein
VRRATGQVVFVLCPVSDATATRAKPGGGGRSAGSVPLPTWLAFPHTACDAVRVPQHDTYDFGPSCQ